MRRLLILCALALTVPATAAAAPVRSAIFFYPWYSNPAHDGGFAHWQQGEHSPPFDIASAFFPARGAYSSADPRILRAQMNDIAASGVDEVVSSWWGRGSAEDVRLANVVRAARAVHLQPAVQLEPYAGRSIETMRSDLAYLRAQGVHDVYIYRASDFTGDEWRTLDLGLTGLRVFAQTDLVGYAAWSGFAGFYTYDILVYGAEKFQRLCDEARAVHILCAPSVGPGYDASRVTGDPRVKDRNNGVTYDVMWRTALNARADLVTITSYNEWSEGTQIEPAGHGGRYESYDGAYGLHGRIAERAYLLATRRWTRQLHAR